MVNPADRLARVVTAIEEIAVPYLVMGGHAARYYGVERTTFDYDLHISVNDAIWSDLGCLLSQLSLFAAGVPEGPSWRPRAFRRFLIGRLPDGREEWLEFWRQNHLLAPFDQLDARREEGSYGGRSISFLGLADLIHSKETERESDWHDVQLLEEIADARRLARVVDSGTRVEFLSRLRSRQGFERAMAAGYLRETGEVEAALQGAPCPITLAFLVAYVPAAVPTKYPGMIGELLTGHLRRVAAGSARHLALVEAVRRLYKQGAMAADREDKQRALRQS
jgi:hypothetical protein